ncbi:nuclear transport factor 2 family protein [Chloroflexota bacterium]
MTISRPSSQALDFYKYNEIFNTGDDKAAMEFWVDDLVVTQGTGTDVFPLATNKAEFIKFLAAAHDGVREIMRVQTLVQNENNIFVEMDMDFVALKDKPDFVFGPLKAGEFLTVKMFLLYTLRGDKFASMKLATWPPNKGVTEPPSHNWGPNPPDFGATRAKSHH